MYGFHACRTGSTKRSAFLPNIPTAPVSLLPGRCMTKTAACALALWASLPTSGPAVLAGPPRQFNFENDIVPILSKFGCNTSGCHGKAEGQNGFKLSVFGFDPGADYAALTQEGR